MYACSGSFVHILLYVVYVISAYSTVLESSPSEVKSAQVVKWKQDKPGQYNSITLLFHSDCRRLDAVASRS